MAPKVSCRKEVELKFGGWRNSEKTEVDVEDTMVASQKKFRVLQEPIAISIPPENRVGMRPEILEDIRARGNSAFLVKKVALNKRRKTENPSLDHFVLEIMPPSSPTKFYVVASKVKPRRPLTDVFLTILIAVAGVGLVR